MLELKNKYPDGVPKIVPKAASSVSGRSSPGTHTNGYHLAEEEISESMSMMSMEVNAAASSKGEPEDEMAALSAIDED
jgi:hypothetical protein